MKNYLKLLPLIFTVFLWGCKDSSTGSEEEPNCTISLSTSSVGLEIGESETVTATLSNCVGPASWTNGNSEVVSLQETSNNIVDVTGVSEGSAVVRATGSNSEGQTTEATLQVEVIYNPVVVYKKSSEDQKLEDLYVSDIRGNERRITNYPGSWDELTSSYQWIEGGERVAYLRLTYGDTEVESVDLEGGDMKTLTDSSFDVYGFKISHSGDKMALLGTGENKPYGIYIQDMETKEYTPVITILDGFDEIEHPTWSSDDQKITFQGIETGQQGINIYIKSIGGELEKITDRDGFDVYPVWSPFGDKIVFISDRDGFLSTYIINPDGSNVQDIGNGSVFLCTSWISAEELVCSGYFKEMVSLYKLNLSGEFQLLFEFPDTDEFSPDWRHK